VRQWASENFPSLAYSISPLENIFHTEFTVRLPGATVPESLCANRTHSD
jgi:hypothetical protein